jgi:hypothetical protein
MKQATFGGLLSEWMAYGFRAPSAFRFYDYGFILCFRFLASVKSEN